MKAIVQNAYGGAEVLKLAEVDAPTVKEGQLLVRARASSVNAGDYFCMWGRPWLARLSVGFPRPKNYILGWDVAGTVEAVGDGVSGFAPGDEVYASVSATFAEYVCASADKFALKPANLSFEEAAAVPSAGQTALQGLRNSGEVSQGQRILVNGASGGVGSFAVQLAKAFGARVTGVCSGENRAWVRDIGADVVIDYTEEDFTKEAVLYDLIMDQAGNHKLSELRRVVAPTGRIQPNTGHGGMGYVFKSLGLSLVHPKHAKLFVTQGNRADLATLRELIEAGKVKPVIDRRYSLAEVPDAMAYASKGHAKGKVVIAIP